MVARSKAAASGAARKRIWVWGACAVLAALALYIHPLFRVEPLGGPASGASADAFDPVAFSAAFWTEALQPAAARAEEAGPVLALLARDADGAARKHARQVGLGGVAYYFLQGSGRVTASDERAVVVAVDDAGGATVALRIGPLFGNTARDGCGLLDMNDFPGLAEFNALSAEINRLVEERVFPVLRGVAAGARIEFAGCAVAPDTTRAGEPLLAVVPIRVEALP